MSAAETADYKLDPNYAVIVSFLEQFGQFLTQNPADLSIENFDSFIDKKEVDENDVFIKLHLKMLSGIGNRTKPECWEKGFIKFAKDFPEGDDKLIEESSYSDIPVAAKLRILKNLCEDQFEYNNSFNIKVNELLRNEVDADAVRHMPVGSDRQGRTYWYITDATGNVRLYRGLRDDFDAKETWTLVCSDPDELKDFIDFLQTYDEDTIVDTEFTETSPAPADKLLFTKDLLKVTDDDFEGMLSETKNPRQIFYKVPKPRSALQIQRDVTKYNIKQPYIKLSKTDREDAEKGLEKLRELEKEEKERALAKSETDKVKENNEESNEIKTENKESDDGKRNEFNENEKESGSTENKSKTVDKASDNPETFSEDVEMSEENSDGQEEDKNNERDSRASENDNKNEDKESDKPEDSSEEDVEMAEENSNSADEIKDKNNGSRSAEYEEKTQDKAPDKSEGCIEEDVEMADKNSNSEDEIEDNGEKESELKEKGKGETTDSDSERSENSNNNDHNSDNNGQNSDNNEQNSDSKDQNDEPNTIMHEDNDGSIESDDQCNDLDEPEISEHEELDSEEDTEGCNEVNPVEKSEDKDESESDKLADNKGVESDTQESVQCKQTESVSKDSGQSSELDTPDNDNDLNKSGNNSAENSAEVTNILHGCKTDEKSCDKTNSDTEDSSKEAVEEKSDSSLVNEESNDSIKENVSETEEIQNDEKEPDNDLKTSEGHISRSGSVESPIDDLDLDMKETLMRISELSGSVPDVISSPIIADTITTETSLPAVSENTKSAQCDDEQDDSLDGFDEGSVGDDACDNDSENEAFDEALKGLKTLEEAVSNSVKVDSVNVCTENGVTDAKSNDGSMDEALNGLKTLEKIIDQGNTILDSHKRDFDSKVNDKKSNVKEENDKSNVTLSKKHEEVKIKNEPLDYFGFDLAETKPVKEEVKIKSEPLDCFGFDLAEDKPDETKEEKSNSPYIKNSVKLDCKGDGFNNVSKEENKVHKPENDLFTISPEIKEDNKNYASDMLSQFASKVSGKSAMLAAESMTKQDSKLDQVVTVTLDRVDEILKMDDIDLDKGSVDVTKLKTNSSVLNGSIKQNSKDAKNGGKTRKRNDKGNKKTTLMVDGDVLEINELSSDSDNDNDSQDDVEEVQKGPISVNVKGSRKNKSKVDAQPGLGQASKQIAKKALIKNKSRVFVNDDKIPPWPYLAGNKQPPQQITKPIAKMAFIKAHQRRSATSSKQQYSSGNIAKATYPRNLITLPGLKTSHTTQTMKLNTLPAMPALQKMPASLTQNAIPLGSVGNPIVLNVGSSQPTINPLPILTPAAPTINLTSTVNMTPTVITLSLSNQQTAFLNTQASLHLGGQPTVRNLLSNMIRTPVLPQTAPRPVKPIAPRPINPMVMRTGDSRMPNQSHPTLTSMIQKSSASPNYTVNSPAENKMVVLGKDGRYYDRSTGKPFFAPKNGKKVTLGFDGKFYDSLTLQPVNLNMTKSTLPVNLRPGASFFLVPSNKNKVTPGPKKRDQVVHVASQKNSSLIKSMLKDKGTYMSGYGHNYQTKSYRKRRGRNKKDVIVVSDSSDSDISFDSDKDVDVVASDNSDSDYDYDTISRRIREAALKSDRRPTKMPSYIELSGEDSSDDLYIEEEPEEIKVKPPPPPKEVLYELLQYPCTVCGSSENSPTIITCEECQSTYHIGCLTPPLLLVPLEAWFCPQCEHLMLVETLKEKYQALRKLLYKKQRKENKITLKMFSINKDNIMEVSRSSRARKEVNYDETRYDKIVKNAVKEMNESDKEESADEKAKSQRVSISSDESEKESVVENASTELNKKASRKKNKHSQGHKSSQFTRKRSLRPKFSDSGDEEDGPTDKKIVKTDDDRVENNVENESESSDIEEKGKDDDKSAKKEDRSARKKKKRSKHRKSERTSKERTAKDITTKDRSSSTKESEKESADKSKRTYSRDSDFNLSNVDQNSSDTDVESEDTEDYDNDRIGKKKKSEEHIYYTSSGRKTNSLSKLKDAFKI